MTVPFLTVRLSQEPGRAWPDTKQPAARSSSPRRAIFGSASRPTPGGSAVTRLADDSLVGAV
jgi:hypothetical protein